MRALLVASMTLFTTVFPGRASAAAFERIVKMDKATIRLVDDGKFALLEIPCTNISPLTITAWSYSIQAQYPDGSASSGGGNVDNVSALLAGNEEGAFRTGVTHGLTARLPLDGRGEAPLAAEATLRMLVFDDLSAVGDPQEIIRLAASRRAMGKMMGDLLEEVEKARQSPDPKRELDALVAKHKSEGMVWVQLGPVFDKGPGAFESVLTMYRTIRDLWIRHSEVKPPDSSSGK